MEVEQSYPIGPLSRWKTGRQIQWMVFPRSSEEVGAAMEFARVRGLPWVPIGDTSNLLICDEDVAAVGICLRRHFKGVTIEHDRVQALGGAWVPWLARACASHGLRGLTHISGIPGTVGGLVVMNGGSQRRSISESLEWVEVADEYGIGHRFSALDCGFGYRQSRFQHEKVIVTAIEAKLSFDQPSVLRREMRSLLAQRRRKFPMRQPNCGSVFRSDPALYESFGPPGKVIEAMGLRGACVGAARVSLKHGNFIVNEGAATAEEILELIRLVHRRVKESTGISMRTEVQYLTATGRVVDIPGL